jgi:hypothetical protein
LQYFKQGMRMCIKCNFPTDEKEPEIPESGLKAISIIENISSILLFLGIAGALSLILHASLS